MSSCTDSILPVVRFLIGDDAPLDPSGDCSPEFTDDRLNEIVLIAAQCVVFSDCAPYQVCVGPSGSITPDPAGDGSFCTLVAYKAACMVSCSRYQSSAMCDIKFSNGPASIDLTQTTRSLSDVSDKVCGQYEQLSIKYKLGGCQSGSLGCAIITPTTSPCGCKC